MEGLSWYLRINFNFLQELIPISLQELMILIFNVFVIILSHQSSWRQSLNTFDDLGLTLNNVISNFLSSLVLYLIDIATENIGDIWNTSIHHFLMLCFILQIINGVGIVYGLLLRRERLRFWHSN
jgi:hypothetical protein